MAPGWDRPARVRPGWQLPAEIPLLTPVAWQQRVRTRCHEIEDHRLLPGHSDLELPAATVHRYGARREECRTLEYGNDSFRSRLVR